MGDSGRISAGYSAQYTLSGRYASALCRYGDGQQGSQLCLYAEVGIAVAQQREIGIQLLFQLLDGCSDIDIHILLVISFVT